MDLEVYIVESLHINIVSFADLDRIKFIERCKNGFIFENTITFFEVEKLYIWSLSCELDILTMTQLHDLLLAIYVLSHLLDHFSVTST